MTKVDNAEFNLNRHEDCEKLGKKSVKGFKLEIVRDSCGWNTPEYRESNIQLEAARKEFLDQNEYDLIEMVPAFSKDLNGEYASSYGELDYYGDENDLRELEDRLSDALKKYSYINVVVTPKTYKKFPFEVKQDCDGNDIEYGDIVCVEGYMKKVVRTTKCSWGYTDGYLSDQTPHVIKKANGNSVKIGQFGTI